MINERENLIELMKKWTHSSSAVCGYDGLADYLLENGVVVLPCKCSKCSHRCNNANECGIYGRMCTENGYCEKALKGGNE